MDSVNTKLGIDVRLCIGIDDEFSSSHVAPKARYLTSRWFNKSGALRGI